MDAETFKSGKKSLRIQKYPDTCGRGLKVIVLKQCDNTAKNATCITIITVKSVSYVSMVTGARVRSAFIGASGKTIAVIYVPLTFIQI